jgi:hypothetical protein
MNTSGHVLTAWLVAIALSSMSSCSKEADRAAMAPPAASSSAAALPTAATTTLAAASEASAASSVGAAVASNDLELVFADGRVTSGPNVLKVKKDDRVRLSLTSDVADELHLHGYNLHLHLSPGRRTTLEFVAKKTGRFTFELHHADVELGAIEVYPR